MPGTGSADGRPADVVAVDRPDGTLAAKYWLDGRSKLPLRRQLFDDHDRVISDISLADLRIGPGSLGGMPAAAAQPWPRDLGGAAVGALRAQGWPLPAELPAAWCSSRRPRPRPRIRPAGLSGCHILMGFR